MEGAQDSPEVEHPSPRSPLDFRQGRPGPTPRRSFTLLCSPLNMIDWASLAEITKDSVIFTKLIYVLVGIYIWEILETFEFEWSLITRQRKFTWPLIVFFLCRYCLLLALIGMIISFEVTTPINCQALYTWNSWTGNMAILSASTSLVIRTIALWDRKLSVAVPLGVLCLAHWVILWRGMFILDAQYSAEAKACIVTNTNHVFLNVSFFTTMGVDFIVLCCSIAALTRQSIRSGLWKLLFQDGLVYFCITFLCNAIPAILNVLNLNTVMNIIATIPAATVSTIAACRLIMRLQDFNHNGDVYVHTALSAQNQATFTSAMAKRYTHRPPEIRITTDQIIVEDDFPPVPSSSKSVESMSPLASADHDGLDTKEFENSRRFTVTTMV